MNQIENFWTSTRRYWVVVVTQPHHEVFDFVYVFNKGTPVHCTYVIMKPERDTGCDLRSCQQNIKIIGALVPFVDCNRLHPFIGKFK